MLSNRIQPDPNRRPNRVGASADIVASDAEHYQNASGVTLRASRSTPSSMVADEDAKRAAAGPAPADAATTTGSIAPVQAEELGGYLRSRRERLRPRDVGLPDVGHRRVRGLRREEVAVLAGIGASWLTRIEQGGAQRVSGAVLDSMARVLQLDVAERAHLFALAAQPDPAALGAITPGDAGDHQRLVAALDPLPAYLLDTAWNLVAWNQALAHLVPAVVTTDSPNLVRMYVNDPAVRDLLVDWDVHVRHLLAQFRLHLSTHPSAEADLLVGELLADPRFAAGWESLDVEAFVPRLRKFDHPSDGRLELHQHRLALLDTPGWHITVFVPT